MWTSKGWARNIGVIFVVLGVSAQQIPQLAPFAQILIDLGAALGAAGVLNVGVNKLRGE